MAYLLCLITHKSDYGHKLISGKNSFSFSTEENADDLQTQLHLEGKGLLCGGVGGGTLLNEVKVFV
jgi:hypothetical protein